MNEMVSSMPPASILGDRRFCYGCGQPVHPTATACPHCGARLESAVAIRPEPIVHRGREVFCRACGRPINAAAPLCPGCGAPQARTGDGSGDKSRTAAVLLAIFLGGLGAHKFYLGHPILGILYILFCWTFIPSILGLIEAVIYLCMSDASFARKYR
jgi:TM2 domain-containing membrane protein YozV